MISETTLALARTIERYLKSRRTPDPARPVMVTRKQFDALLEAGWIGDLDEFDADLGVFDGRQLIRAYEDPNRA